MVALSWAMRSYANLTVRKMRRETVGMPNLELAPVRLLPPVAWHSQRPRLPSQRPPVMLPARGLSRSSTPLLSGMVRDA
jgi:hypothetical protein